VSRLFTLLVGLFAATLWSVNPASGAGPLFASIDFVHGYAYDIHGHAAVVTATTTERGPPAAFHRSTTYDVVGRWWRGTSARPQPGSVCTYTTYDHASRFVQLDSSRATTRTAADAQRGALRSVSGASVAANTATTG
jgi:hypothetical protein